MTVENISSETPSYGVLLEKLILTHLVNQFPVPVDPENPLLCSQKLLMDTVLSQRIESVPSDPIYPRSTLILFSLYAWVSFPSDFLSVCYQVRPVSVSMRATCAVRLILMPTSCEACLFASTCLLVCLPSSVSGYVVLGSLSQFVTLFLR
jgi:hypothetical protein